VRINERYVVARHTSNLKSDPRTTHSANDILTAAGMAAQEHENAALLWSVVYGGKTSQKIALVDGLAHKLTGHMFRHQLDGDPKKIAMAVIAYHLHAVCPVCSGTRYKMCEHAPIRSDDLCDECDGTGKPRPPQDEAFAWLNRYVEGLISQAAGKIMSKLRLDLD